MTGTVARLALAAMIFGAAGFGQDTDDVNQRLAAVRGFYIESATIYAGYSTSAYPATGIALNDSSRLGSLGGDTNYGATAIVGWRRHRTKNTLSAVYSGGYGGMVRYSDVNAYNQSIDLNVSSRLTNKWTATLSAAGLDNTMAQYIFQPARFSEAMRGPLSFDDFAAALSVGRFSDAQVASMLTGAPILESPAATVLYGQRVLSYSGQAGVSYAYSSRLHFNLSGVTAAGQSRRGTIEAGAPANYVMPRSTGANAGAGFSYLLSPRTDVGVEAGEFLTSSRFQRVRGTNATVSLGRKMSRRWVVRVYAGVSLMHTIRSTGAPPGTQQVIGGGSLGVKTYAHTLTGSYDRSTYDTFGFAAGLNTIISAGWSWQRPGSSWHTFAGFAEQQLRDTGFANITGWRASGGVAFRLQRDTTLSLEYARLHSAGTYNEIFNRFTAHSVRISLGWSPARFH